MIARHETYTDKTDIWAKLAAPLPDGVVSWRQDGKISSRDGRRLGMLSTYFAAPHRPSEQNLIFVNAVVNQLAVALEWRAIVEARQASAEAATLDEAPDKPTAVILHHPPIPSGIRWMDPDPGSPWIDRLASVLRGRDQVKILMCGHIHRAFSGIFAGHVVAATAATSIQLTLDLTEVDMHVPDGREILVEEPPAS